jgi:hypothetical protein
MQESSNLEENTLKNLVKPPVSQKYRGILMKILTLREIQTLNPLSAQSTQTRILRPD